MGLKKEAAAEIKIEMDFDYDGLVSIILFRLRSKSRGSKEE